MWAGSSIGTLVICTWSCELEVKAAFLLLIASLAPLAGVLV